MSPAVRLGAPGQEQGCRADTGDVVFYSSSVRFFVLGFPVPINDEGAEAKRTWIQEDFYFSTNRPNGEHAEMRGRPPILILLVEDDENDVFLFRRACREFCRFIPDAPCQGTLFPDSSSK